MARVLEYEAMFKTNVLKCVEEKVLICDVQGYQRNGGFVFKEISFLNLKITGMPTAYLLKPPVPWRNLTKEEQCTTLWLERNYHGIRWDSGDIPYDKLAKILHVCTKGAEKIFVKGLQKHEWLSYVLPNIKIINIEDLGCPSLNKISSKWEYVCHNTHELCAKRRPKCAVENVIRIRKWMHNYFAGKYDRDEIDL